MSMKFALLACVLVVSVTDAQVITMPDLRGLTEAAARARLTESGLRGKVHAETTAPDECQHRDVLVGAVCGQSPRAGTEVSPTLDVFLSLREPDQVAMLDLPALRDLTEARARERLTQRGFTGSITTSVVKASACTWTGAIKPGTVCGMTPEPGKKHRADVAVELQLLGAYDLSDDVGLVPDVVTMTLAQAVAALGAQRYDGPSIRFIEREGCGGVVCESSPAAGTPARRARGSVLLFVGARFPGQLRSDRMPDLGGDSVSVAWEKLDALAFRGTISISTDTTRCVQATAPGLVCGQSPAAGARMVRTGNSQPGAELFVRP
jgi:beta-lactam-binding protein with PASTA domain